MRIAFGVVLVLMLVVQVDAEEPEGPGAPRGALLGEDRDYLSGIERWAVVVGISEYRDASLNLEYADRDAEAIYELLQTPAGGAFPKDHVLKLVNQDATRDAIVRALRSFLKKPAKDDLVLLYFACHGAPDPDRPNVVYLLTHDTNPGDIAGTALSMSHIDLALSETLFAERVIILADTCHSAAIAGGVGRRSGSGAEAVNRYLERLSLSKPGTALLTAAEARETSREDERWGGGHGVFTHFLLEGMRGKADRDSDGCVTIGELFDFVRERVQEETDNRQHPTIGPNPFDRDLVVSVTGGLEARMRYELGRALLELGRRTADPGRYRAAIRECTEALRLARLGGADLPEARLTIGSAMLGLGDTSGAVSAFRAACASDVDGDLPEGRLQLGYTLLEAGQSEAAERALRRFLELAPADSRVPLVRAVLAGGVRDALPRTHVLLLGIGEFPELAKELDAIRYRSAVRLRGPASDVAFLAGVLETRLGRAQIAVQMLVDEEGTRPAIEQAMARLAREVRPGDGVLVYFAGQAFDRGPDEPYMLTADVRLAEPSDPSGFRGGISAREVHAWMRAIPGEGKVLVLDTNASGSLFELADQAGDYALLSCTKPGEAALEMRLDRFGRDGYGGPFTQLLGELVRNGDERLSCAHLTTRLRARYAELRLHWKNTPSAAGKTAMPFARRPSAPTVALELAVRGACRSAAMDTILEACRMDGDSSRSPLYARELAARGASGEASAVLERAAWGGAPALGPLLGALQIHVAAGRSDRAAALLGAHRTQVADALGEHTVFGLAERLESLSRQRGRPRALLVGIGEYANEDVHDVPKADPSLEALRALLTERWGFRDVDVEVLRGADASRAHLLERYEALLTDAEGGPALFYFTGAGSETSSGEPTILSANARQPDVYDIRLATLAAIAGDASGLVSIFECTAHDADPDERPQPSERGLSMRGEEERDTPLVGAVTVAYTRYPVRTRVRGEQRTMLSTSDVPASDRLTPAVLHVLASAEPGVLRVDGLEDALGGAPRVDGSPEGRVADVRVRAPRSDILFLRWSQAQQTTADELALMRRRVFGRPLQSLLARAADDVRTRTPEHLLEWGVVEAWLGHLEAAVQAMERALAMRGEAPFPEAHYELGRALFEGDGDVERAVSELRAALRDDPGRTEARYYLGQSIRRLVDKDLLATAARELQRYLSEGAPLGHEEEVRQFLRDREGAER